ncbi:MAG: hypothetical protein GYA43_14025, partial [Bacteroidales bacterium]|nr:hypothetical protein [Bacteroidales bacterium]
RSFEDVTPLLTTFESYLDQIYRFIREKGLSAIIYTQTTDVETETNGLMTYDRKVDKMGAANISRANRGILPPVPEQTIMVFHDEFNATLSSHNPAAKIIYSLEGGNLAAGNVLYTGPVNVRESCTLKAFAIHGSDTSRTVAFSLVKKDLMPGEAGGRYAPGLTAEVFTGEFQKLPDFTQLKPEKNLTPRMINARIADVNQNFALRFTGRIKIPADGVYGFHLNSDDGSNLLVDGIEVINNDGILPRAVEKSEFLALGKGFHRIEIQYFQSTGRRPVLRLMVEAAGDRRMEVPEGWLFH